MSDDFPNTVLIEDQEGDVLSFDRADVEGQPGQVAWAIFVRGDVAGGTVRLTLADVAVIHAWTEQVLKATTTTVPAVQW